MNIDDILKEINSKFGTDNEVFIEFLLTFTAEVTRLYIDNHIIPEVSQCMNMGDVVKVLEALSKDTSNFSDIVKARMDVAKKAKLEKEPTIEELRQDYIKKSMTPELKAKLKLFKAILKEQNQ